MKKKECIDLLLKIINDIRNENYAIEFINGGYSYSKEITTISKILDTSYFQNVLDENGSIKYYPIDRHYDIDKYYYDPEHIYNPE